MSHRRRLAALACALVVGCQRPDVSREARESAVGGAGSLAPATSLGSALQNVKTVALHAPRNLVENSAAVMSARQPGVFFSINDSGNEPLLFALDTTGASRGVWRVRGATNVDWEAASIGPCGEGKDVASSCVYIGDVGDNGGSHASRELYRFAEPTADAGKNLDVVPEALEIVFSDRPHDVEAMYVAPNGDVLLITKRPIKDTRGQLRQALVFKVPSSAWGSRARVVAMLADSLPIVPGAIPFGLITDASLASDAKHLAVRTYTQVYIFATDSLTGLVDHSVSPTVCDISVLGEYQGEGVTWANPHGRLVFTSEGRRSPLHLGDCALP